MTHHLRALFSFGFHQAMSCLFPVCIFVLLALSQWFDMPYLYRYDWILIGCIAMQVVMLVLHLETVDEMKVIAVFHLIGLALELYKVHMGSWSYPEAAWSKWFGVPLYSGFMYASVASYMCQAWRRLDLKLIHWPSHGLAVPLALAIYFNFFTHHFIYDFRWILAALLFVVFFKTRVRFRAGKKGYSMPLIVSFFLIGFFIWVAENIATFFGAWKYPHQQVDWSVVHVGKISSWFLLVIISFIIVAQLKHVKKALNSEKGRSIDSTNCKY